MKKSIFLLFFFSICLIGNAQNNPYSIIPQPTKFSRSEGTFALSNTTYIMGREEQAITDFDEKINNLMGFSMLKNAANISQNANFIVFELDKKLPREAYNLTVTSKKISVSASGDAGFFYAIQTLYQLMPAEVYGKKMLNMKQISIPACTVYDEPRFSYRGSHLDVARYFIGLDYVKKHLDLMAQYKLNYFHWHLTDDQGWRIEIKQYPKLQEIASMRKQTWIGHYNNNDGYDGKPHGGYFTQEEIKEIVKYAEARHITVIPEIEMPGHATAAIAAYPELSCTGEQYDVAGTWGVLETVFCPSETTIQFLKNVLDEVIPLFPNSPYIHLGGDECPKTRWKECPKCQKLIAEKGLKDEYELQSYFMNIMAQYVISKGKKVIGWDEVLEGGIPDDIIIMSWQGEAGAIDAANLNHESIMCPSAYLYLDYYQGEPESEPLAIGGFIPLAKVYNFDPIPKELPEDKHHYILGPQANLWREYLPDSKQVEYMLFPRLCALAEIAWSPKELRNFPDFINRLNHHFDILTIENVNYSRSHFNVKATVGWNTEFQKPEVSLVTACPDCEIRYNISSDNSKKTTSIVYTKPFIIQSDASLSAAAYKNGKLFSSVYKESFSLSKSTGKSYEMKNVNPQYNGGHALALTDGIIGDQFSWNKWVGTLGNDLDVVLDLDKIEEVNQISMNFLHCPGSWIFAPKDVTLYISDDKVNWKKIETKDLSNYQTISNQQLLDIDFKLEKNMKIRYIKVTATSLKKCPVGHAGAGYDCHLFINEIIVK